MKSPQTSPLSTTRNMAVLRNGSSCKAEGNTNGSEKSLPEQHSRSSATLRGQPCSQRKHARLRIGRLTRVRTDIYPEHTKPPPIFQKAPNLDYCNEATQEREITHDAADIAQQSTANQPWPGSSLRQACSLSSRRVLFRFLEYLQRACVE